MNRFDMLMLLVDTIHGRRKLGEILMRQFELSENELDEALEVQRADHDGRKLGYILIDKGYCPASSVMEALTQQLNVCIPFQNA